MASYRLSKLAEDDIRRNILQNRTYQKMNYARSSIAVLLSCALLLSAKLVRAEMADIGNWKTRTTTKSFSASTVDLDERWYLNYHCDKDNELLTISNRKDDKGFGANYLFIINSSGQFRRLPQTDFNENNLFIYLSDNKGIQHDLWSIDNTELHFFWINKDHHSRSASFNLMGSNSWKKKAVEICARTSETPPE